MTAQNVRRSTPAVIPLPPISVTFVFFVPSWFITHSTAAIYTPRIARSEPSLRTQDALKAARGRRKSHSMRANPLASSRISPLSRHK
jgi:hypothetical protein